MSLQSCVGQWRNLKSGLVFFFGKSKLHQAIQGQLQMFHSRVDLELRGFFFVSGHTSGETHLYIQGQLPGQPGVPLSSLSLHRPLDVTIDSADWKLLRDMINQATKISEFRRAALRCMDENRSFLQQHKPDGNPAAQISL